jgi:hypothetical protein
MSFKRVGERAALKGIGGASVSTCRSFARIVDTAFINSTFATANGKVLKEVAAQTWRGERIATSAAPAISRAIEPPGEREGGGAVSARCFGSDVLARSPSLQAC